VTNVAQQMEGVENMESEPGRRSPLHLAAKPARICSLKKRGPGLKGDRLSIKSATKETAKNKQNTTYTEEEGRRSRGRFLS